MFLPVFQTLCSAGFYRFRSCRWLSAGPPPFLLSLIRFLDHRLPLCFFSLTQWPLCLAWTAIPLWSLDRWLFDGDCTLVDRSSPRFLTDDDRPWTVCVSSEILVFDVFCSYLSRIHRKAWIVLGCGLLLAREWYSRRDDRCQTSREKGECDWTVGNSRND